MSKCVQSGFCCTQAPCGYWETSVGTGTTCIYLSEPSEPFGQRFCEIYNVIKVLEKDAELPMMGSGCSSVLFNSQRTQVIRRKRNALETDIER